MQSSFGEENLKANRIVNRALNEALDFSETSQVNVCFENKG